MLFHFCFYFLDTFGPHTVHTPHEGIIRFAFISSSLSQLLFMSGRELLLWPSKPVKCESDIQKSFMSWPNLYFPTFWLTWTWKEIAKHVRSGREVEIYGQLDTIATGSERKFLWSEFAAQFNYRNVALKSSSTKPQFQLLSQINSHCLRQNFYQIREEMT